MKKLLLGSAAILALSASSAGAADLATRPIPKALPMAPPPVAFSWSGCYIGGHAGGAWEKKSFRAPAGGDILPSLGSSSSVNFADLTGGVAAGNILNAHARLINTGAFDQTLSGPLAGGQIGCNLQFAGNWVIGVEGDASWAGLSGSKHGSLSSSLTDIDLTGVPTKSGGVTTLNGNLTTAISGVMHVKTDFLATITGRIGYAWDRLLIYAKGGGAFAHDKYRLTTTGAQVFTATTGASPLTLLVAAHSFDFNTSQDRAGWTVGAGFEYAIAPNWSVKAEWNYMDFGTKTVRFTDAFGGGGGDVSVKQTVNAFKVGLNYMFNFGKGAPVVARY